MLGDAYALEYLPLFDEELAEACPFIWAAYDKTICPHCGKRIEEW